ncbi:T6SS immunity protein Tdi1 domain-containing protein [Listeria booriae]|uniref:T6SS immunity protein Tdi1 domain-containing protein n=1 Tax=Listeria booriae TaxID=1552123 RepID=UPI00162654DB|nr:T6SS immunity protein Tdi1 domain-containing protein [Listeria booriae]MBC2048191.1 DUF1851 domain-containing protein [Listeria booriae]
MNQTNIFDDFKMVLAVKEDLKIQYADKIPNAMMELWNEFGFGSCMGGYLKIVNPEEYKEILTESYLRSENTIALFATSMGDLILLETEADGDTYVVMVNYRWGKTKVLASNFDYFLRFLEEDEFRDRALEWYPYQEAKEKNGTPAYEECFGYVPLLALGGAEKVDNLKKVKLKEHIILISALAGQVE